MKKNLLTSKLPEDVLIGIVSRLDRVDACTLRLVSKSWLSRISLRFVKKLRRPSPFLVFSRVISDFSKPGLFLDDDGDVITLAGGGEKKYRARNLVFNRRGDIDRGDIDDIDPVKHYSASCRGLMCFYSACQLYAYSPSTNRFLPLHRGFDYKEFKVGIVYIASKKLYKIVLLELLPDGDDPNLTGSFRFTATTLHVEEEHGVVVTTKKDDFFGVDDDTSWEFIGEHALPSHKATLGDLIGVKGAVYAIINLNEHSRKVLSLNLEGFARQQLKIFNLPSCCDENDTTCRSYCETDVLSEVKDRLCYPHHTTSSIDLWLLKDHRNSSCSWFKAYTVCNIPSSDWVGPVFYFPCPTAANDDDGNDAGAGLILLDSSDRLFQYDTHTKEVTVFQDDSSSTFQVVADRPFLLQNGFKCTSLPPLHYLPPPTKGSPPPSPPQPLHSHPLLTKGSLAPPLYPRPPPPQVSLPPPPPPPSYSHPPRPQGSIPPPQYYHHNLQHTANGIMPGPPPTRGLPPPFNPQNFPDKINSSEVKRRKLDS